MKKIITLILTFVMLAMTCLTVGAADVADATIDFTKTGSISLYKYDLTNAVEDGVWSPDEYVSTGKLDKDSVNDVLANYALEGVEFTYVKIADFKTVQNDGVIASHYTGIDDELVGILNMNKATTYSTDTLNKALADAIAVNATEFKNKLEAYVKANGGTAMPETDSTGNSSVANLKLGLYLLVETRVPENVTTTTNPFFVSVPMTTIDGKEWNYDIVVYPKNQTGDPTLDKVVKEAEEYTGKDGYDHSVTASIGDIVDYRITSTLPEITSTTTYLTTYTYVDTIDKGLSYNKDVNISIYEDSGLTTLADTWTEGKEYTINYTDTTMTIEMTAEGLAKINPKYSTATMAITYTATINNDAVLGDIGNNNDVVLTWKRTNTSYYDTLTSCCHVYTFGIDLTKKFVGKEGDFSKVSFNLKNATDDYYAQAELIDGVWYITSVTAEETTATKFVPTTEGKLIIRGLEDDDYILTELTTDEGFDLLAEDISISLVANETNELCNICGAASVTLTGTVDEKPATLTADGDSINALVSFAVENNLSVGLPETGEAGAWLFTILGTMSAVGAGVILFGKKRKADGQ